MSKFEATNFGYRGTLVFRGQRIELPPNRDTMEITNRALAEAISKYPGIHVREKIELMTRPELMRFAKKKGVPYTRSDSKEGLIEKLGRGVM